MSGLMRIIKCLAVGIVITGWATVSLGGGKFNKVLGPGDSCPKFAELKGVDDRFYGLDNFKDKDVLVIWMMRNNCPICMAYEERIISFVAKHAPAAGRVGVLAVCPSTYEYDRLGHMKLRAKSRKFNFPYVFDETQKLAASFGATVTPEFFVFDKDRKLVYTGPFDDELLATKVKAHYVEDAVAAALKGEKPAVAETKPSGILITYEKQ